MIRALKDKDKNAYKLFRNLYKRVEIAFLFFIPFFEIQHPHCGPIKKYLYNNENSPKGFSFKQSLYYLQDSKKHDIAVNPYYAQQYITEEEFVTNYIYILRNLI
ncbi:hypothetical protein [Bacillus cereus]|uniref:hypothetical protein n=1 Tax=Bacillus cereus TaxID=1396 RepID=UPI001124CE05|nr:hypothetical protein [Bacillus cereus]WJX08370.1 hypothetical protein QTA68_28775 [Bacillus cereus]